MTTSLFITKLRALLADRATDRMYACIEDLVENGLAKDRFPPDVYPPSRQDVTQYLAAWSRYAGMSDEETRDWLIEYTATVLVVISRRTPAAIRHSTKSNIKYIYGSAVEFVCGGLDNRFRARCSRDCPIYAEMEAKRLIQAEEARNPKPYVPPVLPVIVPVKVANREQFQAAMQLVREELEKGTKKPRIVEILQERGFKTRTGRPWTRGIFERELTKLRAREAIVAREKSMTRAAPAPPQAEAGPIEGPRDTGG